MSNVTQWRRTDADNNAPPPDGWPEGMAASTVNDAARADKGGIRRQWEDKEWFDRGTDDSVALNDTDEHVTVIDGTSFSVPGDKTGAYQVNRRVRAVGTVTGTIYGAITDSVFGTLTTVTVLWDSGSMTSESLAVSLGAAVTGASVAPESVAGVATIIASAYPIGGVTPFAGSAAPTGWLLCDGASHDSVADTTLATLFTVIGLTYGGSGAADFRVPNLQGRVAAGVEAAANLLTPGGSGIDGGVLGDVGGLETYQLKESELAAHTHPERASDAGGNLLTAGNNAAGGALQASGSTGGDQAHQNTQPTIMLNYIIKAK